MARDASGIHVKVSIRVQEIVTRAGHEGGVAVSPSTAAEMEVCGPMGAAVTVQLTTTSATTTPPMSIVSCPVDDTLEFFPSGAATHPTYLLVVHTSHQPPPPPPHPSQPSQFPPQAVPPRHSHHHHRRTFAVTFQCSAHAERVVKTIAEAKQHGAHATVKIKNKKPNPRVQFTRIHFLFISNLCTPGFRRAGRQRERGCVLSLLRHVGATTKHVARPRTDGHVPHRDDGKCG